MEFSLFDKICYINKQTYAYKKKKCDDCGGVGFKHVDDERYKNLKYVCTTCHGNGYVEIDDDGYAVIENCYILHIIYLKESDKYFFTVGKKMFLDDLLRKMKRVYESSKNEEMKSKYRNFSEECVAEYFDEVYRVEYIKALGFLTNKYGHTKVPQENIFKNRDDAMKFLDKINAVMIGY